MAYRMLKVEYTEDGAIQSIKDNTAIISFDWKKLVAQKRAEKGTANKDLDAINKISICRRKGDAEPEDNDMLDKILTEYPNDVGAGRIKLSVVPVNFQDLWRYGTTDDTKLRDRKSAPLCRGYMLVDRVGFEHTARMLHQGMSQELRSSIAH